MVRERFMALWVAVAAAVAVVLAVFVLPAPAPEGPAFLPWQVERVNGSVRVFGMTLGETPLAELEARLKEEAEISLFRDEAGRIDVEAYFDRVALSGLRARLVANVELEDETKAAMYERGLRVATLGSGTRKVTLSPEDLATARRSPLASLTYLPKTDLSPDLIEARFGTPTQRLPDRKSDGHTEHWLYPEIGLDIAVSPEAEEVLLYVSPAHFGEVVAPLREGISD